MATPNLAVPQSLSQSRRIAVLDIETVSLDPTDPRGALDAMTGRVACIGLLIDDGHQVHQQPIADLDEKKLLERFWAALGETDLFVGHGLLEFDLPFLRQRSWILNVQPSRTVDMRKYYTTSVFDTLAMWTNWSNNKRGATLDNIAWVLGCGRKNGHGSEVAAMWANREYVKLMDYCMSDCWLAYKVYCRMNYRDPLGHPLPIFSPQRELVPVAAAKPAAPAPAAQMHVPESRPMAPPPAQLPAPRQPAARSNGRIEGSRESREIVYRCEGNALVLSGFTVTIRKTLKEALQARGKKVSENPARYEWTIGADKWEPLVGLCQKTGIRLIPSQTAA